MCREKTLFWQNPSAPSIPDAVAHLDVATYNVPKGEGTNLLGSIVYDSEQFFSEQGKPNTARPLLWAQTSQQWLDLAANLEVWLKVKAFLLLRKRLISLRTFCNCWLSKSLEFEAYLDYPPLIDLLPFEFNYLRGWNCNNVWIQACASQKSLS